MQDHDTPTLYRMGKIERGERNVTFLNILRVARTLGYKPSDLLIDAGL